MNLNFLPSALDVCLDPMAFHFLLSDRISCSSLSCSDANLFLSGSHLFCPAPFCPSKSGFHLSSLSTLSSFFTLTVSVRSLAFENPNIPSDAICNELSCGCT
ncbi:hypothetical protein AVEN_37457-1 [Araneus ventricosus]|uniref:Uncharacterized protein n=1 Tax=Araneus ventricosus TaxID=182803 RepID=A0A4Y2FBU6_ARAVE|nr:hypothetical protein AVEN_37457-1 [Araneus ventricosus]